MTGERKRVVLCVEDEALLRVDIADYLRQHGFTVIEAATADEAMKLLTVPNISVDLVFTDIQMPGTMDGIGLVRWLGLHRPWVRVAITSGSGSATERAVGLSDSA